MVTGVAFSSDGQFFAAGERQGHVVVWGVASWQKVADFQAPDGGLNALTFSPDSRLLASAGRSLRLWSTKDWKAGGTLGRANAVYGTARFSNSGEMLATVNASERIELWNIPSGKLVRTMCCMALYGDVAFSPDSRLLAATGHWPRLWDVATGGEVRRLVSTREPTFAAVAFRGDGKVLVTGSQDGKTRLWDVATGAALGSAQPRRGYIEAAAFHPDGQRVAYVVREGAVWLWNTATGVETEIGAHVTSNVAFSADGRWLGYAGSAGRVHVRDMDSAREDQELKVTP